MNDTMCSSILYVITAINCGICPNTTANTNITCIYTQSKASVGNNYNNSVVTCMLAVQTEICGYLRGEKSEYITVHIDGKHNLRQLISYSMFIAYSRTADYHRRR